tara:strand:+ start:712 stop:909 length:198 start_codon:yes stop_codon:yes gene_type:complete
LLPLNFFSFFATLTPVSLTFCFSDFNEVVPTLAFGIDAFTFTNESISISFLAATCLSCSQGADLL